MNASAMECNCTGKCHPRRVPFSPIVDRDRETLCREQSDSFLNVSSCARLLHSIVAMSMNDGLRGGLRMLPCGRQGTDCFKD